MARSRSVVLACSAAIALIAAGGRASVGPKATVVVFAAASLSDVFRELGDTLERRDPAVHVAFDFAGSQTLAFQIVQGAAADVFASADNRWMSYVRDSGFVAGEPHTFARNRLVVIVPQSNPGRVQTLQDLARSGLKVVLAGVEVPAGRYARDVLSNLEGAQGFAPDFRLRVLANVVSTEENVRSVALKVRLGEADAGFVYATDVTPDVARYVRVIPIPDASNVIASYPIAVLRHAAHPGLGRAFVDLVLSPVGQATLARHGFTPLESAH